VNLKQALANTREILTVNEIDEPNLEGEILLRHLLGIDRTQLFSNLDIELDIRQEKALERILKRRVNGEPSAYITGHREFFGLDFNVDQNVLIPRPETELLIEKAIEHAGSHKTDIIVDAGTGCGVVAITLALQLPNVKIYATDISSDALNIAAINCRKHAVSSRITLLSGDILEPIPGDVDLVIANLPYVKVSDLQNSDQLGYEPIVALDGGLDGKAVLKRLIKQVGSKLKSSGNVLIEIGQGQVASLIDFIKSKYPEACIDIYNDLAGIERVIKFSLTKNQP
jgi:release factor glutamine methyltransferase